MCSCSKSLTLKEWHDLADPEEVIEPGLEIIDAHHHLWDPFTEPRGLLTVLAKTFSCMSQSTQEALVSLLFPKPLLYVFGTKHLVFEKYLMDDLARDYGGHNVIKTVQIEAWLKDPTWYKGMPSAAKQKAQFKEALKEAKINYDYTKVNDGFPQGFVGHLNLKLGKEKILKQLDELLQVNPNLKGIRHSGTFHKSKQLKGMSQVEGDHEGMLLSAEFQDGIAALGEKGMTYDAYVWHTQLEELSTLASKFPNVLMVLNHIGQPLGVGPHKDSKEEVMETWKAGITSLAQNPNVYCKLSGIMPTLGLGFDTKEKPPSSDEILEGIKPYYEFCIDSFGVERCMFASNFPVDKVSGSYLVIFNAYKKLCNQLGISQEDKEKLFSKNAAKFYRLE